MAEALARNAQRFPEKASHRRRTPQTDATKIFICAVIDSANYLLGQGVAKGDRVALSCGNRAEHLEFIFAFAKIGAIAVPFDYGWSTQESAAMLDFFEPSAFLIEERPETKSVWEPRAWTAWSPVPFSPSIRSGASPSDVLRRSHRTFRQTMILRSTIDGKESFHRHDHLRHHGLSQRLRHRSRNLCAALAQQFHQQGLNDARTRAFDFAAALQRRARLGDELALSRRARFFCRTDSTTTHFVDLLEREHITYTILVPALCQRLLRHPKIERIDKSSLELCRHHRRPSDARSRSSRAWKSSRPMSMKRTRPQTAGRSRFSRLQIAPPTAIPWARTIWAVLDKDFE